MPCAAEPWGPRRTRRGPGRWTSGRSAASASLPPLELGRAERLRGDRARGIRRYAAHLAAREVEGEVQPGEEPARRHPRVGGVLVPGGRLLLVERHAHRGEPA